MAEQVAVVIPNWNGARFLPTCLHSLRQQTFRDFVVYLVDNGSVDDSRDWLAREHPEVVLVALPTNLGYAGAINAGIRASKAPWVVALNNDTECDAHWLEGLIEATQAHPEAAFFSSKVLGFDARHLIDSYGNGYTRAGLAYRLGNLQPDDARFAQPLEVFGACGAASMYRRSMLDDIGLLDDDFFCYMEDVDLDLRARHAGYRCMAVPAARVFHIGAASSGGGPSAFSVRLTTRNLYHVMLKNLPLRLLLLMLPLTLLAQAVLMLRALARSTEPRNRALLAGYGRGLLEAMAQAPAMLAKRRQLRRLWRIEPAALAALIRKSERQRRESLRAPV